MLKQMMDLQKESSYYKDLKALEDQLEYKLK